MKTSHDIMRERLLKRAGLHDRPPAPSLDYIYKCQWNAEFERFMRNRMAMGFFRYGPLQNQIGCHAYDNVKSIEQRLAAYKADDNLEHLVDIANLALIEFTVNPQKPFKSADDGLHTPRK